MGWRNWNCTVVTGRVEDVSWSCNNLSIYPSVFHADINSLTGWGMCLNFISFLGLSAPSKAKLCFFELFLEIQFVCFSYIQEGGNAFDATLFYLFYISASGLNVPLLEVSACGAITADSIDYSLTFAAKPALNFVRHMLVSVLQGCDWIKYAPLSHSWLVLVCVCLNLWVCMPCHCIVTLPPPWGLGGEQRAPRGESDRADSERQTVTSNAAAEWSEWTSCVGPCQSVSELPGRNVWERREVWQVDGYLPT